MSEHAVFHPFAGGISTDPHPTNLTVSGGATPSRTSEWLNTSGLTNFVVSYQLTGADASPDFTVTIDVSAQSAYELNNKTATTADYVALTVVSGATSGVFARKDATDLDDLQRPIRAMRVKVANNKADEVVTSFNVWIEGHPA